MQEAASLPGFLGVCLVDTESGLMLSGRADGTLDLRAAASFSIHLHETIGRSSEMMDPDESLEEVVITTGKRIHLVPPLVVAPDVLLYVCLDKEAVDLGMVRIQVKGIAQGLLM